MEKLSLNATEAVVNVYHGDDLVESVTRAKAREMKATGGYFFVNHGRDLRKATELGPVKTLIEQIAGWNMLPALRNSALNRGRAGQGVANYPIPYVFEGHITSMRVSVVNAGDRVHA